jgi:Protein of unknown function (DUF402)
MSPWAAGERVTRREVWHGRPLSEIPVTVVRDAPGLLVVHLAEGAPFRFPAGDWPTPHPWSERRAWSGHGVLMLHRPGDTYSVWVFWIGEERTFDRWYVNFERPLRRTDDGFETLDHEIDLWSRDLRTWHWKDEELLARRAAEGWFTREEAAAIETDARGVRADLAKHGPWWDQHWTEWTPPAAGDRLLTP